MTRRRLDRELVRRHLADTRAAAQRAINDSRVRVGGVAEPKAATLVDRLTPISLVPEEAGYVSRGGAKLAGALRQLPVPVAGRRALDAGASTGGFTDCLLQEGASHVTALDVGYGQLHWRLRGDPRVRVMERTNLRHVHPAQLDAPFGVVVADLSFISLGAVAAVLAALGDEATDYVLLVKPQFELGRDQVGKGGVVRDRQGHARALRTVVEDLARAGLGVRRAVASPLPGAKGNREFFVWARRGPVLVQDDDLAEVVA
ncbi:MAG: TlyA family RNA methyltransferase [Actinomycetota bacterium]|nr:TlyA family RNA methyltransferase [Actinomycetota bacterium]